MDDNALEQKMLSVGKPDIKKTKSMISDKSFNINNSKDRYSLNNNSFS